MIELQNKELANHKFNIDGQVVTSDANGVIKVSSKAVADALGFAGFKIMSSKKEAKVEAKAEVEAPKEDRKDRHGNKNKGWARSKEEKKEEVADE